MVRALYNTRREGIKKEKQFLYQLKFVKDVYQLKFVKGVYQFICVVQTKNKVGGGSLRNLRVSFL